MAGDCGHLDLNPPPRCEYEWWVVAPSLSLYFSLFLSLSHTRSLSLALLLSFSRPLSHEMGWDILSGMTSPLK